mmetsp:Transcript_22112/g.32959  ORF Transcript_22112/g.32959 Transcript_22112/m.32959 type:complete len:480 (-) Transcript_22112:283-1722(-)
MSEANNGMPASQPLEKKDASFWNQPRFAPKTPLMKRGRLNKKRLCEFFEKCEAMLLSAETAHLLRQAKSEGLNVNQLCVKWQHEMFEHLGIDKDFGVRSLQSIKVNFPSDKSMPGRLMRFAKVCQCSVMKSMLPYARAGEVKRRFKPASTLRTSGGVMAKPYILQFFKKCSDMLRSKETKRLFQEAKARGEDLQKLSIRWQREMIEQIGYEQEFGVNSMMLLPLYFPNDRQLMMEMQLFQNICQRAVQNAMAPSPQMADFDISKRRYQPKKGLLRSKGRLPRDMYKKYFLMTAKELTSDTSVKLLKAAKREGKNVGLQSVKWQREIFENLGIEQDYGVECLNRLTVDYPKDKELHQLMFKFAKACADLLRRADPEGAKKAIDMHTKKVMQAKGKGKKQKPPSVEGKIVGPSKAKSQLDSKPGESPVVIKGRDSTASKKKTADAKTTPIKSSKKTEKVSEDEMALMMMMMAMEDEKNKKK